MLRLDKIQFMMPLADVEVLNESVFEEKTKNGALLSKRFKMDNPFNLSIELNYGHSEAKIEFTGKILKKNYPSLISIRTIDECIANINQLGVCRIELENVLNNAVVNKCDVTIDFKCDDLAEVISYIGSNLKNYKDYSKDTRRNGNLILEKNVTKKYRERLTFYDKEAEMGMSKNRDFVERYDLQGEFDGVCRAELNLTSMHKIREALQVNDTSILNVLRSHVNPIKNMLSEILSDVSISGKASNWKTYLNLLVLNDCGYDLSQVEAKMRALKTSRGSHIRKSLEQFEALINQTTNQRYDKAKIISMLT